jgi:SOS-response transcriptional repressor LexA
MTTAAIPIGARHGEFAVVQLAWPGLPVRNIGVLLLDPEADRMFLRFTEDWDEDTDPEYLAALEPEIVQRSRETGAAAFLRWCEDTLSNVLLIAPREAVEVDSFSRTLERLYREHVGRAAVRPFTTHLPLYSLRAAAGRFGHEQEVAEEDWVPVPGRLNERMFVAHVVGRSMEPRIPEGSLNVFEAGVVGSRQDMIVLAEIPGTADTTARYTVKKYTSTKSFTEDSWQHESVTLLPLNREFEPISLAPDECIVVARWIRTLE